MNIIKKITISALLSLAAIGLTTSLPAFADGASDAALYCTGCHNGLTVSGPMVSPIIVGGGSMVCQQRSVANWVSTINRMNGKGCGVPSNLINGIATYLNNWWVEMICYRADGTSFLMSGGDLPCPPGTSTTPPPVCSSGQPTFNGSVWICPTTTTSTSSSTTTSSTTTSTWIEQCRPGVSLGVTPTSLSFTAAQGGSLPPNQLLSVGVYDQAASTSTWGVSQVPAWLSISPTSGYEGGPTQVIASITTTQLSAGVYTATIYFNYMDGCRIAYGSVPVAVSFSVEPSTSTTNTSTSTTTTSSTTTTTLCNTYVNGTTQYPYSGSGSCHSFAIDDMSGAHIVRDQAYCKKHMSHYNNKGNHVHAYPHPMCM